MITGTFLDDVSPDLPSLNFGPEEWTREFAAMRADGIDTASMVPSGAVASIRRGAATRSIACWCRELTTNSSTPSRS